MQSMSAGLLLLHKAIMTLSLDLLQPQAEFSRLVSLLIASCQGDADADDAPRIDLRPRLNQSASPGQQKTIQGDAHIMPNAFPASAYIFVTPWRQSLDSRSGLRCISRWGHFGRHIALRLLSKHFRWYRLRSLQSCMFIIT